MGEEEETFRFSYPLLCLFLSCCRSPPPAPLLSYLAELLPLQMYVTNLLLEERGGRFTDTNDPGCQEADGILCWEKFFFRRLLPLLNDGRDTHLSIRWDGYGPC